MDHEFVGKALSYSKQSVPLYHLLCSDALFFSYSVLSNSCQSSVVDHPKLHSD